MYRRAFLLLAITAILVGRAFSVVAQSSIEFQPPDATFACEDTARVELWVDTTVVDLRGFSIVLEFDAVLAEVVAVAPGGLVADAPCGTFLQWLNADAPGDSVVIDGGLLGCSVDGAGPILSVDFLATDSAEEGETGFLRCRQVTLRDSLNRDIAAICSETTFGFDCPIRVDAMGWSAFKSLFR